MTTTDDLMICSQLHITTRTGTPSTPHYTCRICGSWMDEFDTFAATEKLDDLVHRVSRNLVLRVDDDDRIDWEATIDETQAETGVSITHDDGNFDAIVWLEEDADGQVLVTGWLAAWDEDGNQIVDITVGPIMAGCEDE